MPPDRLHMNVFEITHSRTASDISGLETQLAPRVPEIVNWTFHHRARLVKPLLGYDASAVALTFVPANGTDGDEYSYHHLRRDLYDLCTSTGVPITSRYTVPSAHLTIARFMNQADFSSSQDRLDLSKITAWVDWLKGINEWLRAEYWPKESDGSVGEIKGGGEWIVGQEKGLDHRRGTLWYGGGETVMIGKGF
jgi:vesicle-fusing ATPase